MSKILNWGECLVLARKYADNGSKGSAWTAFDTPVESSTTLETTEGDKTEATVEGGDNEAVRRAKNKYALSLEERMGAGYTYKLDDEDGVIDGEYEVLVVPKEYATAPSMYIPKASASVSDSYNSADGTKLKYTFDALKNDLTSENKKLGQVIWGTVTISGNDPTSFTAFKDTKNTNLLAKSSE